MAEPPPEGMEAECYESMPEIKKFWKEDMYLSATEAYMRRSNPLQREERGATNILHACETTGFLRSVNCCFPIRNGKLLGGVELSEYQKQIAEEYVANVETEVERWQNARNARKAYYNLNQETMDNELETQGLLLTLFPSD